MQLNPVKIRKDQFSKFQEQFKVSDIIYQTGESIQHFPKNKLAKQQSNHASPERKGKDGGKDKKWKCKNYLVRPVQFLVKHGFLPCQSKNYSNVSCKKKFVTRTKINGSSQKVLCRPREGVDFYRQRQKTMFLGCFQPIYSTFFLQTEGRPRTW